MRPNPGLRRYWEKRRKGARRLRASGKPRFVRPPAMVARMKAAFLVLYAETGLLNKTIAALQWPDGTTLTRLYVNKWCEQDPEFATRYMDARVTFAESLEGEAHRRAVIGVDKPVYYKGEEVGAIREFSDTLLVTLLKANLPDKYRDRIDVSVDIRAEIRRMAEELGVDVAEAEWAQLEPRLLGKG